MRKWFQSKKFLAGLLAAAIMVGRDRLGIDMESAQTAAWALVSGAGIEGVTDVVALLKGATKHGG